MDDIERQRLIAQGTADNEHDTYPRICEVCGSEYHGNHDAAIAAGWRVGWDGWACVTCLTEPMLH